MLSDTLVTGEFMIGLLARCERGNISVLTALAAPVLVGAAGLAIEYGTALAMKQRNQRVADAAAYAAALAYAPAGSMLAMQGAASRTAVLNGMPGGSVIAATAVSPVSSGNQAISATVTSTVALVFSRVLGAGSTLPVRSRAVAEIVSGVPGCIFALSPAHAGVVLSGGTSVSAPACTVTSNAAPAAAPGVVVPCGTTMVSKQVAYNSATAPLAPCGGLRGPGNNAASLIKTATADPLADATETGSLRARLAVVAAIAAPPAPAVAAGPAIEFGYNPAATAAAALSAGCTALMSGSTWTLTCPGTLVRFASVSVGGGIALLFNTGGSPGTQYEISGTISNGGTSMTFGPGIWRIGGGITNGGSGSMTFGAGSFAIGRPGWGCGGTAGYSICQTSSNAMTFAGPSSFSLAGGVHVSSGATLAMGGGAGNSYSIGSGNDGRAITVGGGGRLRMGDSAGTMQFGGQILTGGGTCLALGAAPNHDIKGSLNASGAVTLGAGTYTATGFLGFGVSSGGDVVCNGVNTGVAGTDVTFVVGASETPTSGSCLGQAFCVAAGYGTVSLTAPSSGFRALLIGPAAATAGARFTEGAGANSLVGTVYMPKGVVSLSGGAGVGSGAGQCLTLIGTEVRLTGGSVLATDCLSGAGYGGARRVTLVQ